MDKTIEGAEIIVPTPKPREMRKKKLVKARTFTSNRRSRYSYAV
jgi:hypothetical protein